MTNTRPGRQLRAGRPGGGGRRPRLRPAAGGARAQAARGELPSAAAAAFAAEGRAAADTAASEGPSRGRILRAGTAGLLSNVLVTHFTDKGLLVDGNPSKAQWAAGALSVSHSLFFQNPTVGVTDYHSAPRADGGVTDNMFDEPNELAAPSLNNRFDLDPKLAAATSVTSPSFQPLADSPVLMGGATAPADGFFDPSANFIGAVGTTDWTVGWTAFPEN